MPNTMDDVWAAMRSRAPGKETIAISAVSRQGGGLSERKALVVVVGKPGTGEENQGRLLSLADLRVAVTENLSPTARAGGSDATVKMTDVLEGYNTGAELPVLFVEDDADGEESLSMFLYGL